MFLAMHIPDGFLSLPVALVGWAMAVAFVTTALFLTGRSLGERQIPLLGLMGAFIFAAQALNFPIAGGTSGHILGATLAAIVLGPWAAVLVMACVVGLQGLLFADGGLLSMGWNIVNMGVIGAFVGYALYRDGQRVPRWAPAVTFFAAWLAAVLAATATALELAASGTTRLSVVLPAMVGVHMIMGCGEGIVTVAAVAWLTRARPEALQASPIGASGAAVLGWGALLLCLCAPLAYNAPDGLDSVAEHVGFKRLEHVGNAPMTNYAMPFLHGWVSTILAMLAGVLVLRALLLGVGRLLTVHRAEPDTKPTAS